MRVKWLIAALIALLLIGIAVPAGAQSSASSFSPPPQEPEDSGLSGIINSIRDTIQDRPLLVVVIGVGALLLVVLDVALIAVMLRGRRGGEEPYAPSDFEPAYGPEPAWQTGPTTPGTPVMGGAPMPGETQMATSDWAGMDAEAPAFGPPPAPAAAGPQAPAAGGTRIIERAPKHLAMLVDRVRPDRRYDLKGTTKIGRTGENHIVLDDPTVSRQHAWIKAEGEEFLIFDIGSANGTFVNDERVEEPRWLKSGDIVRFGDVELAFTKVY